MAVFGRETPVRPLRWQVSLSPPNPTDFSRGSASTQEDAGLDRSLHGYDPFTSARSYLSRSQSDQDLRIQVGLRGQLKARDGGALNEFERRAA